MESMILLNEVAALGDAIDDFEFEKIEREEQPKESRKSSAMSARDQMRISTMAQVAAKKDAENPDGSDSDSDEDEVIDETRKDEGTTDSTPSTPMWNRLRAGSDSSSDTKEQMEKVESQESLDKAGAEADVPERASTDEFIYPDDDANNVEPPIATVQEPVRGLLHDVSTTARIKSLLDVWEEPVNKADKMVCVCCTNAGDVAYLLSIQRLLTCSCSIDLG